MSNHGMSRNERELAERLAELPVDRREEIAGHLVMELLARLELEEFADAASDGESWIYTAEDLIAAAEHLEQEVIAYWNRAEARMKGTVGAYDPDPTGVYFMLMAYALENLCKAALVDEDVEAFRDEVVDRGQIPGRVAGHDLSRLLSQLGFQLCDEDRELVWRLERNSVWSARYPVPRRPRDASSVRIEGTDLILIGYHSGDDVDLVKDLVRRVREFLDAR